VTAGPPPSPFDELSTDYDHTFSRSEIGRRMRAAVWHRLDRVVHPGQRVLEVNCGTGEDAVHLARRGVRVHATDASPAMVAATREKVAHAGLSHLVSTEVLAIEDLDSRHLSAHAPFDAVLSNFGGLNCVHDLHAVGRALGQLTRRGAVVVACVMGPVVPWEWGWYLAHGEPRRAIRRLRSVTHWRGMAIRYPAVGSFQQAFAADFAPERVGAVGVLVPPTYAESWAARHPRALDLLHRWEQRIAHHPLAVRLADHYLVELRRR
jgi:SAM-dependent methyltransferase